MIRKIIAENAIYRSDAITGTFLKNGYDEMGLPWSNVYISFCGDKKKTKIAEFAIHESSCKASDMCHELIPDLLMKATIDAVVMNEKEWIESIDWDRGERPSSAALMEYMSINHINGCLQICHIGHGATYLLVVNGEEYGNIWLDERTDYGGIEPLLNEKGERVSFISWFTEWLDEAVPM